MNVAIVTDSNSGIFEEEGKILGVHVIPMPVILEGKTYYEGIDLTHEEFYQCLEEKREVFSSQPSPAEVLDMWDKLLLSEYDELVYIPMSSGLSGSCQTAQVLAQDYEEKVQVVDNHRISVTQKQSVLDALMLKEKGCSAKEIKEALEQTAYESIVYVGVETLEYLKMGGRVTPAGAAMSTLLSIKPLLVIAGERLDAYAKVRGTKSCKKRLLMEMKTIADEFHKNSDMMAALLNAADRGVKVQILVDGINGTLYLRGSRNFRELTSHENVEVKLYNPITLIKPWKNNYRMHDKYMIADDLAYILGGRNTDDLFLGNYIDSYNEDRDILVYETVPGEGNSYNQIQGYFKSIWNLSCCRIYGKHEGINGRLKEHYQEV